MKESEDGQRLAKKLRRVTDTRARANSRSHGRGSPQPRIQNTFDLRLATTGPSGAISTPRPCRRVGVKHAPPANQARPIQPRPLAARTMATMPALTATGSFGNAATTS